MATTSTSGQGLSLNTIIIAALCIIVLIILILIFSGRINIFDDGLSECPSGECRATINGCPNGQLGSYMPNCNGNEGLNYCCPVPTTGAGSS